MPHHVPELQAVTAASASLNATTRTTTRTTTTTTGLLLPYPFTVATQGTQTPQPMCLQRLRVPAALGRFRLRGTGGNATLGGHGYGMAVIDAMWGWSRNPKMDPMLLVFFGGILISLCLGSDVFPVPRGHFWGSISKYVLEVYSSTVFCPTFECIFFGAMMDEVGLALEQRQLSCSSLIQHV